MDGYILIGCYDGYKFACFDQTSEFYEYAEVNTTGISIRLKRPTENYSK